MIKREIEYQKKSPIIHGQKVPYIPEAIYDNLVKDLQALLDLWNYEAKYWDTVGNPSQAEILKKCIKQVRGKL